MKITKDILFDCNLQKIKAIQIFRFKDYNETKLSFDKWLIHEISHRIWVKIFEFISLFKVALIFEDDILFDV